MTVDNVTSQGGGHYAVLLTPKAVNRTLSRKRTSTLETPFELN